MKKILFAVFIIFSLSSCKISSPSFKRLGNWNITKLNANQVTVSNMAYFYNPNNIDGIKVKGMQLYIRTDGRKLGAIESNEEGITIPKLSDFQIPLSFTVNIGDLVGNLSSILGAITGKTIQVRCTGRVKVGYMFFGKSINIDQTVPVNLKDIK